MTSAFDHALSALEPRQARFVREYLADLNGQQAAVRAGYSRNTARSLSTRLLAKARVARAVAAGQARLAERTNLRAEWVIDELRIAATADIAEAYNADGSLRALASIPETLRRAIQDVDVGKGGKPKRIRLSNKVRSLELLARHLGMLTDNLNVSGSLKTMTKDELDARILALTGP